MPGRDHPGLINSVSWELVPRERWVWVDGTALDSLNEQVHAAVPDFNDWGNSEAYRHADTACGESKAQYELELDAGTWEPLNHWFSDEVYWDRVMVPPIGTPTSRHVYDGFIYSPATNELVMASRRLWRYSLSEHRWVSKHHPTSPVINGQGMGEEIIAVLDEPKTRLIIGACGSGGPWSGNYDLDAGTWLPTRSSWGNWELSGAGYTCVGNLVTLYQPAASSGSYASPGRWQQYDVSTHTVVRGGETWQYRGGLSRASFPDTDHATDGTALVFWVYTLYDHAMRWLTLDLTTDPPTLIPKSFSPSPEPSGIARRRAIYFPRLHAIEWFSKGTRNVQVYRF